ncbi:hypothetical protein [Pseudonocardia oroxyli]|uniref:hypothetical protein n=1 Tax=Pseudonocardia oroxyli TaxID=366584 RepID=UPI001C409416|nr:hypothetical protein [Pseudonocardia oroxyli]
MAHLMMPFGVRYGRPPLPPQRQRAAAWRACAPEIDLLFGARTGWAGAALLGDTPWAEVDELGRRFRAVWGAFVRTGEIPAPVADAARDVLTLS